MVGGATTGYGQAVTVDGTRDYLYGFPRVWQTVQTGYGDNQSELDAAYSYIGGGNLNLFLNGNLQAGGNKLFVFLDTDSGSGQNRLRGDNDVNLASLLRLGDSGGPNGLTFESGFAADHAFVFNISGSNLYLDYENLPTGTGGLKQYVGSSTVDGGSGTWTIGSGMLGVEAAINNTNALGVSGGSANGQVPALSNTGLELKIPLGLLGTINQSVKVIAFISSPGGDFLSNQFLPDIGASSSTANLDEPRGQDFSSANHPGTQFFYVQPRARRSLWATRISSVGTLALGSGLAANSAIVALDPDGINQLPSDLIQLSAGPAGSRAAALGNYAYSDYLKRTLEGSEVLYFGYNAQPGVDTANASTTQRTLAWVSGDHSASFRNFSATTQNRSATAFNSITAYFSNAASQVNMSTPATVSTVSGSNARVLNIFNNRLYWSASSAINAYPTLPSGTATSASIGALTGLSNCQDFAFDNPRTLYVLLDSSSTASGTSVVRKYTSDGSSWSFAYSLNSAAIGSVYARSLHLVRNALPEPRLYITTGGTGNSANNNVLKVVDTGSTFTVEATVAGAAGSTASYRGIDWSPEPWLAPVANNDASSTDDATPINGNVLTNDSGEVKQNATVVSQSGPGSFSLGNDGSYTYTPNGTTGTAVLTYKFDDSDQDSNSATLTVTVSSSNAPPVATGGSYSTNINTPKSITLAGTDPDSDPLTYAVTQLPTHGALSGTAPNLTYTPDLNYSGPDSFKFKVNDGTVDSGEATIDLTVNGATPTVGVYASPAPNVYGATNSYNGWLANALSSLENTPGTPIGLRTVTPYAYELPTQIVWSDNTVTNFYFWMGVLNPAAPFDTDLGHRLQYTFHVLGNGHLFSLEDIEFDMNSTEGSNDMDNDGWMDVRYNYGADLVGINYGADRMKGGGDDTIINSGPDNQLVDELMFRGPGNAWAAVTDMTYPTPTEALVAGRAYLEEILGNQDIDISGTVTLHNGGHLGAIIATGSDTVTMVTSNVAPVGSPQTLVMDENTSLPVVLSATDSNAFEVPLTYAYSQPAHGTVTGTAPNVTYTPNANYTGPDSFTFTATDVYATSSATTVSITVNNTNDAPVASDASYSTGKNAPVSATGVATDPDSDPLTYTVVTPPAHGTLSGTAPSWVYTPAENYVGSDSFTFKANDGHEDSNTATVSLTVMAAPPVTMEVLGSPAPNAYGSPSWPGYRDNALDSLEDPSHPDILSRLVDPTAYETPATVAWYENVATPFGFWMNVLHPSAPFAGEYGHRMHFGVHILGNGTRFSLSALDFDMNSSDSGNDMDFDGWFDGTDPNYPYPDFYGPSRKGIDYGPDRIKGTGDDIVYQTDDIPAEMMVDELVYVGIGNAWDATFEPGATDYDKMVSMRSYLETILSVDPIDISTTYTLHESNHASPVLGSASATVQMVTSNVAPLGSPQTLVMDENTSLPVVLSATDSNAFEVPLTYAYGQPAHGTVTGTAPNVTYTPNANYTGPDSFTFTATDVYATSSATTVSITVNNVNQPPVANDASFSTNENTSVNTPVTANDPDSDPLTYTVVTPPAHGTLSGTGPNWVYAPTGIFTGVDTFTFKANDGTVDSNVATVTITVSDVSNISVQVFGSPAPNAYGSPSYDGYRVRALNSLEHTPGVPDGLRSTDPTAYELPTQIVWSDAVVTNYPFWLGVLNPSAPFDAELGHRMHYGLHILGNGTRFNLEDLEFDMSSSNDDNDLSYEGDFVGLTYAAHRVGIDYGPDRIKGTGDDLTYNSNVTPGSTPVDELVYVGVGNAWDATPPELGSTPAEKLMNARAYLETLLFAAPIDISTTYTLHTGGISGPVAATGTGTVQMVTSNTAPTANSQSVSVTEDGSVGITLAGSDTDSFEVPLTYTVVTPPAHGTLSGVAPNLTYAPDPNYAGSDSFTFTATDVTLDSAPATVSITVVPVNDPPSLTTIGDKSVNEHSLLSFTLSSSDIDGGVPAYSATGLPLGATLVGDTFNWTPSEVQGPGDYTVTFEVSDGNGGSDSETITIHVNEVNEAPTIDSISDITADEMTLITFDADGHDADLPAQTLTYSLVGAPSGAVIDANTGVFSWTPTEAQGPNDYTFTVRVSDGTLDADESVTIHVGEANVAPTIDAIADITAPEMSPITFDAEGHDADLPANVLTYSLIGAPSGATIDANTGVFSWTPTEAQGPTTVTFTVRVSDGALTADEVVVIQVDEVNVAPVANGQSVTAQVNTDLAITLTGTDADLPANTLTFVIVTPPSHGTLAQSGADVTYTPTPNYSGPDSFTFKVNDGTVDSALATVNINVAGTTITLNLTLQSFAAVGPTTRGMTMWLGGTAGGSNPPVDVSRDVVFDSTGHATVVFGPQDGFLPDDNLSTYAISVKDELHSLRSFGMLQWDGDNYEVDMTLLGGNINRDGRIDIGDYVVYAVNYGSAPGADSPLSLLFNPLFRHADISGNGVVDGADFTFISSNFGLLDGTLPGNYSRDRDPIRRLISVADAVKEAGSNRASYLDRNHDGWITVEEAMQPLSPTTGR